MSCNKISRAAVSAALFGLVMVCGCNSGSTARTAAIAPIKVECEVPEISKQAETREMQPKGGIEITVTPVTYKAVQETTVEWGEPSLSKTTILWGGPPQYDIRKTTKTQVHVEPQQLRFLVKVVNQSSRVFHGAGTVVQFNAGGRVLPVDQMGYANFTGLIIPPRQEQQIEVVGPSLEAMQQKKGTVGFFLYDVVTGMNDAGAVTEKQNFEWFFDYATAKREVEAPGTIIEDTTISQQEYVQIQQQKMMKQQTEHMRQMGQAPGAYPPPQAPYPPTAYPH